MLDIGFGEFLVVFLLLLVVVGPERLPGMLRWAGRHYARIRRAANELQQAFMEEADRLDDWERPLPPQKRRTSPSAPPSDPPSDRESHEPPAEPTDEAGPGGEGIPPRASRDVGGAVSVPARRARYAGSEE